MELQKNKIEFDMSELMPLLFQDNKQEGFKYIGEKILNSILEKEFEAFIGASKHERSDDFGNRRIERSLGTLS